MRRRGSQLQQFAASVPQVCSPMLIFPRKNFAQRLLRGAPPGTIGGEFRAIGLFPVNVKAIPDEAYAPRKVTERPAPHYQVDLCVHLIIHFI